MLNQQYCFIRTSAKSRIGTSLDALYVRVSQSWSFIYIGDFNNALHTHLYDVKLWYSECDYGIYLK